MSEGNIITDYFVNIVAILIILGGFIWLLIDAYQEAKITVRKKVVVIEGRGLRKVMTNPLHKTAAKHFSGKIDPLTLDITQRVRDGEVIYPQDTFNNNIKTIVSNIATRIDGIDHQDLTLVYGGLLPVPFTFYIGAILDDNGPVSVFDWDRTQEDWRLIDNNADDDHTSFTITEEPQDPRRRQKTWCWPYQCLTWPMLRVSAVPFPITRCRILRWTVGHLATTGHYPNRAGLHCNLLNMRKY